MVKWKIKCKKSKKRFMNFTGIYLNKLSRKYRIPLFASTFASNFINVKRPQLITIGIALLLTAGIFIFGRTVPKKKAMAATEHGPGDGHDHGPAQPAISIDTILNLAKKELSTEQIVRLSTLENSISRGDVKDQQLHVYHQLARFWADSAHVFEPYAWYNAEAARLENSEKNLTFAAQGVLERRQNYGGEQHG